jgi:hypothetical protein
MTPRKGLRWPLRDIINAMKEQKQTEPLGFDDLDPETRAAVAADLRKFNVHASNISGENASNQKEQALGLIRQAELLEADAQNIRMRAIKLDPDLGKNNRKRTKSKTDETPAENS